MADQPSPGERLPVSRRAIAIVFAVVCALLAAGYLLFLRTDYAVVYSGLKPTDAAAIVAQLDAKGVLHRLRDDGTTILVPEDQVDGVRLAVAGSDVPLKGAVGFELFNKSDMGLTDFAQKINYQRALQGELTRSITMLDGVETARVHLAIPDRSLFRAERTPPKAAVEVVAKIGAALGEDRVRGIQRLVAAAVPELDPADVTVLDGEGRVVSRAPEPGPQGLSEQAAAQAYYEARAKTALAQALPGVSLAVHVLAIEETGDHPDRSEGARAFPLRVTIVSAVPLVAEEQAIARGAVTAAVGLRPAAGDTLAFQVGPTDPAPAPPLPAALPSVSATPSPPVAADVPPSDGPAAPRLALAALALLAAAAWLVVRTRAPSEAAEEALAARLRSEIAHEADARA